jgi:hypothetical protein
VLPSFRFRVRVTSYHRPPLSLARAVVGAVAFIPVFAGCSSAVNDQAAAPSIERVSAAAVPQAPVGSYPWLTEDHAHAFQIALATGGGGARLATLVRSPDIDFAAPASPVLSPDGRWVYYLERTYDDAIPGNPLTIKSSSLLRVADTGGTPQTLVTLHDGQVIVTPRPAPDGSHVAYLTEAYFGSTPATSLRIINVGRAEKSRTISLSASADVRGLGGWANSHEVYLWTPDHVAMLDVTGGSEPTDIYNAHSGSVVGDVMTAFARPDGELLVGLQVDRPEGYIAPAVLVVSASGSSTPVTGLDRLSNYSPSAFIPTAGGAATLLQLAATCDGGALLSITANTATQVQAPTSCGSPAPPSAGS